MTNEKKIKLKKTTITVTGDGDHNSVIEFAQSNGFEVKTWGKRGPTGPRKKNQTVTGDSTLVEDPQ